MITFCLSVKEEAEEVEENEKKLNGPVYVHVCTAACAHSTHPI